MITYKLIKSDGAFCAVLKNGKDSFPFNVKNSDFQEFIEWVKLGNKPVFENTEVDSDVVDYILSFDLN
jgi:hypothetical protein